MLSDINYFNLNANFIRHFASFQTLETMNYIKQEKPFETKLLIVLKVSFLSEFSIRCKISAQ
jgi:hypothetical protein